MEDAPAPQPASQDSPPATGLVGLAESAPPDENRIDAQKLRCAPAKKSRTLLGDEGRQRRRRPPAQRLDVRRRLAAAFRQNLEEADEARLHRRRQARHRAADLRLGAARRDGDRPAAHQRELWREIVGQRHRCRSGQRVDAAVVRRDVVAGEQRRGDGGNIAAVDGCGGAVAVLAAPFSSSATPSRPPPTSIWKKRFGRSTGATPQAAARPRPRGARR